MKEELGSCKMGKCDENGSGLGEAMQLAAAKQQYAEHMDSLRAEVDNFTYCMLETLCHLLQIQSYRSLPNDQEGSFGTKRKENIVSDRIAGCAIIVFLRVISD